MILDSIGKAAPVCPSLPHSIGAGFRCKKVNVYKELSMPAPVAPPAPVKKLCAAL